MHARPNCCRKWVSIVPLRVGYVRKLEKGEVSGGMAGSSLTKMHLRSAVLKMCRV